MAKCSSDPRVAYPEVNVQVRDIVRVVGIVGPFSPRGFSIRKNSFYRVPAAVHHRRARQCSGTPKAVYALLYFQDGGMKHDQELYAKVSYIPSEGQTSYVGILIKCCLCKNNRILLAIFLGTISRPFHHDNQVILDNIYELLLLGTSCK